MRALDNWIEYTVDGKPIFGRFTFYKLHTTEKVEITSESGVALSNPILSDTYGRTSSQVFLPDEDITVVMEKYIGSGDMSEAPDTIEFWSEVRTFDSLRNTTIIDIDGQGVVAGYAGTITELREMDITNVNYAMLTGYHELGDMPPVFYKLEVNNISADDGGSVVRADTEHVWRLITPQILDVRVFGVFPSDNYVDVAPQNSQLQAAFNYANSKGIALYMPAVYGSGGYYAFEGGAHNLTNTLYLDNGAHLCAKTGTTSTVVVDKIEGAAAGFLHYDGVYNAGKITLTVKSVRSSWLNDWNQSDYVLVPTNELIVDSAAVINAARTFSNLARVSIEQPNWDPGAAVGFDACQEFVSPGNLSLYGNFKFYNMTGITDRWWNISASSHRLDVALVNLTSCNYTLHDFSYVENFVQLKYTDGERSFNLEGRMYNALTSDVYNNTTWINGEINNLNLTGTVSLRNIKGSVYYNTAGWSDVSIEDCYITGSLPFNITGNFYCKSSSFTSTYQSGSSLPIFHGSSCTIRDSIFNGYTLQVPYNAVITGCTFDKNGLGAYSNIHAHVSYPDGILSITFSDNVLNGAKLIITTQAVLQNGFLVTGAVFVGNAITDSRDGTNFIKWQVAPASTGHSYTYNNNTGPNVAYSDRSIIVLKNVPTFYAGDYDTVGPSPNTPPGRIYLAYSSVKKGGEVVGETYTWMRRHRLCGLLTTDFNVFSFGSNDHVNEMAKMQALGVRDPNYVGNADTYYVGTAMKSGTDWKYGQFHDPLTDFIVGDEADMSTWGAMTAVAPSNPYSTPPAYQDVMLTIELSTQYRIVT